jgi:hypothetical protein
MKVYHGSIQEIRFPLAKAGRPNLDFGRGFYVTDIRRQAEEWAERIGLRMAETPMINVYELDMELACSKYRVLKFKDYDKEWLDFIVASRSGKTSWMNYDMVEGGVANDRVIDTIEAYMIGNMTLEMALGELAKHRPNNQLCLINQALIDECLHFVSVETVNLK